MVRPVVSTIKYRTKYRPTNTRSATVSTGTNHHKQSGTFNWLKLALTNPYLDSEVKDKARQELNSKVAYNSKAGVYFAVTAGRLSPYTQWLKSKAWFGRFSHNEGLFTGSATGTVYKYLLTLNRPNWTSKDVSKVSSKVIRRLKKNADIGLIFRATGTAPTYQHGKPTLDYHVHFKVLSTARINKRKVIRSTRKLTKANVSLVRINPKHDRTNGYLSDQRLWFKRYNKLTGLTYLKTFQSFKNQQQKKLQAELYYDRTRPFAVYVNKANATARYAKHVKAQTKPKHNLSLFNTAKYDSEPQTKISHHHYSRLELYRHRYGLNIYTGELLKRTYKQHKAYPVVYHHQLGWNITELQRLTLFDTL